MTSTLCILQLKDCVHLCKTRSLWLWCIVLLLWYSKRVIQDYICNMTIVSRVNLTICVSFYLNDRNIAEFFVNVGHDGAVNARVDGTCEQCNDALWCWISKHLLAPFWTYLFITTLLLFCPPQARSELWTSFICVFGNCNGFLWV